MSAARAFDAVIFDMDGVLIDSEPLWQKAEIELFGEIGVELTPELCAQTMGLRIDEVIAYWRERFPWGDEPGDEQMVDRVLDRMVELIRSEGRALEGVEDALGAVEDRGLRLALATSSFASVMDAVLTSLDLTDRFEVVHSGESEDRGKPDPAIYLSAAESLGVHPERCIAVEDSVNGVRSAVAAGMTCVAIPDIARGDRRFEEADVVVENLSAFATWLEDVVPVDEQDREDTKAR